MCLERPLLVVRDTKRDYGTAVYLNLKTALSPNKIELMWIK